MGEIVGLGVDWGRSFVRGKSWMLLVLFFCLMLNEIMTAKATGSPVYIPTLPSVDINIKFLILHP
jgi:hypothetical protein